MEIRDLYRDVILDHNRSPRNFGRLEPSDAAAVGHNPLCGDALSLTLRLDGDRLSAVRFNGQLCDLGRLGVADERSRHRQDPRRDRPVVS